MNSIELFNNIMKTLFISNNKSISYYKNSGFSSIPEQSGIYSILRPENFNINILDVSQGPEKYKGEPIKVPDKEFSSVNQKYLYIGKASSLKERLKLYINFGYENGNTKIRHHGGSNLWFINDNKNLLVGYAELTKIEANFNNELYIPAKRIYEEVSNIGKKTDLAEAIEAALTELHKLAYNGYLPFANRENENTKNEYKLFWANYWKNIL